MKIQKIYGGNWGRGKIRRGKGVWCKAYPTTSNGWADEISSDEGEVIVKVYPGDPGTFARYIRGDVQSVVYWLKQHRPDMVDVIKELTGEPKSDE